jgi:hypothetical protein
MWGRSRPTNPREQRSKYWPMKRLMGSPAELDEAGDEEKAR